MLADQLRAAIVAARSDARLVELSRTIWQGHAAGALDDEGAQALSELVHACRTALRGPQAAPGSHSGRSCGRPSIFPPKRPQRSPDRARSLERRRTLAASGPLPPSLASRFTTGELAALRIVADEVRVRGACELCVAAISARAGISASTTRNAIRTAARLGLLMVEERRRHGQRNDTNRLTVVDASWQAWITKGGRGEGGGFKFSNPTDKEIQGTRKRRTYESPQKGYRKGDRHQAGLPSGSYGQTRSSVCGSS